MTSPRLLAAAASTRTEAEARLAMTEYEIHYSKVRAARGSKAWCVFQVIDEQFSRGIAAYATRAEAVAAVAALKKGEKP